MSNNFQETWNRNNYSIEYPDVPIYVRVSDTFSGAKEFERQRRRIENTRRQDKIYMFKRKIWSPKEIQFLIDNYFVVRRFTAEKLGEVFNVSKCAINNQLQKIRNSGYLYEDRRSGLIYQVAGGMRDVV